MIELQVVAPVERLPAFFLDTSGVVLYKRPTCGSIGSGDGQKT